MALAEWLDPALLEPPNTMQRIMSELAPRILNLGEVLSYFVERVAPLGVLESFAAGTAVVASDLGGMAELIEDGVAGLLVPPKDAAGLAAAMQALWNDPSRAYWMGERALQFAQVEMDLLGQAQRMLTLYRSLTGAGRPQTGEEVADSARSQRARGSTFSKQ